MASRIKILLKIFLGAISLAVFFAGLALFSPISLFKTSAFQNNGKAVFTVEKGKTLLEIAKDLKEKGIVINKEVFVFYVMLKGREKDIVAGDYLITDEMSAADAAEKLINAETILVKLTIPEGFNNRQVAESLKKAFSGDFFASESLFLEKQKELEKIEVFRASDLKGKFSFLEEAGEQALLDGFLFPDTYQFSVSQTVGEIAEIMLENFDKKFTLDLREEIEKQGKTVFDIVIMASLLEKEVRSYEERQIVSGILWKRIEAGMPLQVDATIAYLLGKKTTSISIEETKIDSLYNTYKYKGLPAGPICNPGISAIKAAVYPEDSDFWFYLSTPEGETIFSKTYEEHLAAKYKYLK